MRKYLFITYGATGWRGVQVRAIRMAQYLPKDEVIFWNCYDSRFIQDAGFMVETKDPGITLSSQIEFPEEVEMVIFSDLPTNEFFNYAVYNEAIKKGLKIVICEQIYRRGQMQETVYKKFAENSDLFLLNALSFFKTEETENIKVVPPQIEISFDQNTRIEMCQKYQLDNKAIIIYGVGYHEKILEKIKNINKKLSEKKLNFHIVVTGSKDLTSTQKEGKLVILPFNIGDDFFKLLYSSDLVLTKFGFLQILEALALKKPTVVLGAGGFTLKTPEKIDEILKETVRFDLEITNETVNYFEKFIQDQKFRNEIIEKVSKLHDGQLHGGKMAAEELKKLIGKIPVPKKQYKKRVAILVNNEIKEKETWLKQNQDVLPLCFITGMPTENSSNKRIPEELLTSNVRDLNTKWPEEILPHSFKQIYLFSERRLDGFTDIYPWYETWVSQIESLIKSADEVYLTSQGKEILSSLVMMKQEKIRDF